MINNIIQNVRSLVPGSNVISNITVELVKKGFMYTAQIVIPNITVAAVTDVYFDPSAFTKDFLVIYDFSFKVSQGKAIGTFYAGGTYSAGTTIPIRNRNENSLNTPETVISYGTGLASVLGVATNSYIAGTEAQGNNLGGGGAGDVDFPTEINKSVDRLFRIVQEGGTGDFDLELRLVFAEIEA